MKKVLWVCLLAWIFSTTVRANDEVTADVAKSLEQIAVEAKETLTRANILDVFDW